MTTMFKVSACSRLISTDVKDTDHHGNVNSTCCVWLRDRKYRHGGDSGCGSAGRAEGHAGQLLKRGESRRRGAKCSCQSDANQ